MNIALIGYGKMGKVIEQVALSRGHKITGIVNSTSPIEDLDFSKCDIAIEFTTPELAVNNIKQCLVNDTPVVVGTTAWSSCLPEVLIDVESNDGSLLYASNFSIGVNLFFDINERLAKLMSSHNDYTSSIHEIHHVEKLDAPSGTAVSLADQIITNNSNYNKWSYTDNQNDSIANNELKITADRIEGVPGTHEIVYQSEIDTIELKHTAHNRSGFALGAVVAAEFLINKKGVFTMKDVIKL